MVRFLNPKSCYNPYNHMPGCLRLSGRMFVRLALDMDSHKSIFYKRWIQCAHAKSAEIKKNTEFNK